jgi:hypothetical protein
MKDSLRKVLAVALLGSLLASAVAVAAEAPTRPEYVERLEAICKPRGEATERAVRGVRADIKAKRLTVAAGKLGHAATIFAATVKALSAVPRPEADAAKLEKWFGYLGQQELYLGKTVTALSKENTGASQRANAQFVRNGNLANNTVLAFGFKECSFKFSRFG